MSATNYPIYMDNNATTPCDPRVVEAMLPYFTHDFGNAASRSHAYGWTAEQAVEKARDQVAALIGASGKEIVWTSGATESNNLAIKGAALFYKDKGNHIITATTEHKAVLDTCKRLEKEGFEVTYLPVASDGRVEPARLKAAMTDKTVVVSIMAANNEIGVINPIEELGAIVKERGAIFHIDAVQAVGKIPFDVNATQADLVSISAHKMYGPKGVGALYVRRKPRVRLVPIIDGGGHERGMRSGTLNVPAIVGFGKAAALCQELMPTEGPRSFALRERLRKGIEARVSDTRINGSLEHRLPGNLNMSFAYIEGEAMLMALKDVAVSSGSACTSASLEPSYVLRALGVEEEMAHTSIRFGLGRFNTEEEVDHVIELVVGKVEKLRAMSPLYEMVQQGIDLKSISWQAH
jgi:cysteine desulfurase